MQIEIQVGWSQSLKDKRRVVKSLKDKLHRSHQVSVAEVGQLDDPRSAVLGIALVCNDKTYGQGVFNRLLESLRHARDFVLNDYTMEYLAGV